MLKSPPRPNIKRFAAGLVSTLVALQAGSQFLGSKSQRRPQNSLHDFQLLLTFPQIERLHLRALKAVQ